MSYFCAAARSAKTLSYDVGISVEIGYITVMRARTNSASSAKRTKGNPSTVSSLGGWGSENMSLKTRDEETSTALWTRKLTESDDWSTTSALLTSKHSGRGRGTTAKPI